jgi:hypothetical protein
VSTPARENSGKLLILGVFAIALAAAAASWWFRYNATHQAAKFWGPEAVRLIRDAPRVTLRSDDREDLPRDISQAHGLTHLRAALLEDRSYDWAAAGPADTSWSSSLVFEVSAGAEPRVVILFSPDFNWAGNGSEGDPASHAVSTNPIAKGLAKFFTEEAGAAPAER